MVADTDYTDNKSDLLQAIGFVPTQREILTQRISLPIIGEQNATQIRMAVKDHAKEIKRVALVSIRGSQNTGDTRHVSVFLVQHDLQTNAMVFSG